MSTSFLGATDIKSTSFLGTKWTKYPWLAKMGLDHASR